MYRRARWLPWWQGMLPGPSSAFSKPGASGARHPIWGSGTWYLKAHSWLCWPISKRKYSCCRGPIRLRAPKAGPHRHQNPSGMRPKEAMRPSRRTTCLLLAAALCGCTSFYRTDYYKQTLQDPDFVRVDCGESPWFGAKDGVKLPGPGRSLFICSKSQSGRWFTMGFLVPIFPVSGRKTWSEDLRWIKFGLKPQNYQGWKHTDSLEIRILGMEYADSGDALLSVASRSYNNRLIPKRGGASARFKIYSEQDRWLGIPGKGDVLIEFEAEGFGRRKVRFSPASGYGITFLTV
jgi:hypothetical protein